MSTAANYANILSVHVTVFYDMRYMYMYVICELNKMGSVIKYSHYFIFIFFCMLGIALFK